VVFYFQSIKFRYCIFLSSVIGQVFDQTCFYAFSEKSGIEINGVSAPCFLSPVCINYAENLQIYHLILNSFNSDTFLNSCQSFKSIPLSIFLILLQTITPQKVDRIRPVQPEFISPTINNTKPIISLFSYYFFKRFLHTKIIFKQYLNYLYHKYFKKLKINGVSALCFYRPFALIIQKTSSFTI